MSIPWQFALLGVYLATLLFFLHYSRQNSGGGS
jgi:hypothetical protein